MGFEKCFERAQSHRFAPYYGFTKRLHLAYLYLLGDVNLNITVHHWSKQWSERCGLQLYVTAAAIQHSLCLPEMLASWLRVPECCDNDPTSPTSVARTLAN